MKEISQQSIHFENRLNREKQKKNLFKSTRFLFDKNA